MYPQKVIFTSSIRPKHYVRWQHSSSIWFGKLTSSPIQLKYTWLNPVSALPPTCLWRPLCHSLMRPQMKQPLKDQPSQKLGALERQVRAKTIVSILTLSLQIHQPQITEKKVSSNRKLICLWMNQFFAFYAQDQLLSGIFIKWLLSR